MRCAESKATRVVFVVLALVFSSIGMAVAQGIVTGTMTGSVVDANGAVLVGAKVTAKKVDTNQVFSTSTNGVGVFLLASLPPGTYQVSIEAPRFRTVEFPVAEVRVATRTQLGEVKMQVGGRGESVEVAGTAPMVESTSAQISATFVSQQVSDLPIGRGVDQLALFLPGVASAGSVGRGNNNGAVFSSNGQRPRSNNFQIDGQGMNDASVTGPAIFLENSDVVAEYQVMTNYDAAYGRNTGSQVNIITKGGTNVFHGSAYEFWRGSKFDSRTNEEKNPAQGWCLRGQAESTGCTTVSPVARYVRNMFGATVGGPIVKDKAWFFGSAFWDRDREGGGATTSGSSYTPTADGITALKSAFPNSSGVGYLAKFGPALTAGSPTFGSLVTVNVTSGGKSVPVQFGTVSRSVPSVSNVRQFTGRVDYQLTSKDKVFGRYLIDDEISTNVDYGDGAAGYFMDVPSRGQQIGLDWTHQFSDTFFNDARVNYTRLNLGMENGTTGCNRGDPTQCPIQVSFRSKVADTSGKTRSLLTMGLMSSMPQGRLNNAYQFQDNASLMRGKHTIKFGGEYNKARPVSSFLPSYNGVYSFTTFDDFISNSPYRLSLADGPIKIRYPDNSLAFYFQDDWRVLPNLTLNLGLRWEWFAQTMNTLHDLTVEQQSGSSPFWNTSLPLSRTTLARIPNDTNNFGPVFGFAWTPKGNTVVRGGFRIAYDPAFYNIHLNAGSNAPLVNSGNLTFGVDKYVPGLPSSGFTGADTRAVGLPYLPRGVDPGLRSWSYVSPDFHNPYSQQWTFGVQRQINSQLAAEVRYLGNHTVGLFQQVNGNPAVNALAAAGFSNLIPSGMKACSDSTQPGYVTGSAGGYVDCTHRNYGLRTNSGYSIYHGLQSRLEMRSFHGVTGTLSYTWSHMIDNASDIYSTGGAGMLNGTQNPFDYTNGERGDSNFDYRHVFGLNVVYDVPFLRHSDSILGKVLGGWQSSVTYRYSSGQPYTPIQLKSGNYTGTSLCDASSLVSTSIDLCRPILGNTSAPFSAVGQITSLSPFTIINIDSGEATKLDSVHWIINDTTAAKYFGSPFLGIRRNQLRGQSINAVNFSMQKSVKFTERVEFQLRATAFNVLNHMYLGVPGNNVSDTSSLGIYDYQSSGGGSANVVEGGISRRRLEFGGKIRF